MDEEMLEMTLLNDPAEEALRLVEIGRDAGLTLRVMGGLGVRLCSPSAAVAPLARSYGDIDLAAIGKQRREVEALLKSAGYVPDEEINILHGTQRLIYWDEANGRQLDVLMDKLAMCHEIDLASGMAESYPTIDLADLLLSKLQVFETTDKDYRDLVALLLDHPLGEGGEAISITRLHDSVGSDWGLWRTTSEVLGRTGEHASTLSLTPQAEALLTERIAALASTLEDAPKSRRWKMRARVGDRVRWYEVPDEAKTQLASG
jgi:hypothetical protein